MFYPTQYAWEPHFFDACRVGKKPLEEFAWHRVTYGLALMNSPGCLQGGNGFAHAIMDDCGLHRNCSGKFFPKTAGTLLVNPPGCFFYHLLQVQIIPVARSAVPGSLLGIRLRHAGHEATVANGTGRG